jgi:hypothetical protein
MLDVTVRFDLDGPRNLLNSLKTGVGDRAVLSILNKTTAQAKTRMSQAIRADYNISAGLVGERLRIRRATRRDIVTFTASLIGNPETGGRRRSMNLVHFLEKQAQAKAFRRGKGWRLDELRFKVKKGGGKQMLPGAFVGNKGRTVFIRTGKTRLPIKAVRTIGVPQMFNTKKNIGEVRRWISLNLPRIAQSEMAYYLKTVKR